jgi:hypothetical protein
MAIKRQTYPRVRTGRVMPEAAIQRSVVRYLRTVLPAGFLVVAVSNNPRSAIAGAREKGMGMLKGWPDLAVYGRRSDDVPFAGFLEVKAPGGYLRPEQRDMLDRLQDCGHPTAVVRGLEDVQRAVIAWGLPVKDLTIRLTGGVSA